MKTIAYIAVSLDGYIADKDGGVDWLNELPNPDDDDMGFTEFMAGIDALLMGSNTFSVVHGFGVWPYEKPVFVATNSLKTIPEGYEDRISLIQGEIDEILDELQKVGHENIYVDGGKIIQSCLEAGLLNELIVTHIPILLGDGIPLFRKLDRSINLKHVSTEVGGVGLVMSHYQVAKTRQ